MYHETIIHGKSSVTSANNCTMITEYSNLPTLTISSFVSDVRPLLKYVVSDWYEASDPFWFV